MRPMPMEFVTDPDDQGSAMEVDDVDTPEIFGEGVIASDNKLAYADFFNNFETESVESVESIPPQPPSSSQALVSATSSPSVLCLKSVRRSALFGAHCTTLQRFRCRKAMVGENDLLIVGPGVLGRLVAKKWREIGFFKLEW